MPDSKFLEMGAVVVLFFISIREFFTYLKSRKENGSSGTFQAIFRELQTMNSNHLHSIKDAIEKGNERLVDTIHDDNTKMIELLGEIKGRLK